MSLFDSMSGIGSVLSSLPTVKNTTDASGKTPGSASFAQTLASTSTAEPESAVDKFLKYQQMTMGEKIRASFLSAHGLTEDDLKAMSADDRQKIEDQIKEELKKKLAEHTGGTSGPATVAG